VSLRQIAELAFRLHAEERITREELVHVVQQCINAAALENGYADVYGLPFAENGEHTTLEDA